jgi:chromosome segregation ATPase
MKAAAAAAAQATVTQMQLEHQAELASKNAEMSSLTENLATLEAGLQDNTRRCAEEQALVKQLLAQVDAAKQEAKQAAADLAVRMVFILRLELF